MTMDFTDNKTKTDPNTKKDFCSSRVDKKNYVQDWLDNDVDDSSSEMDSSTFSSSVIDSEDLEDDMNGLTINVGNQTADNKIITSAENETVLNKLDVLQHVFNTSNSIQTLGNVFIEKSKDVHIGNITYINGPIHITQTSGGSIGAVYQTSFLDPSLSSTTQQPHKSPDRTQPKSPPRTRTAPKDGEGEEEEEEREEVNQSDAFIGSIHRVIDGNVLKIVNRCTWLAQRPLTPYDYYKDAAKYVIISHTSTEEGTTQAENIYLVRNIQTYHVESRRWNDIAYNFLIGCDGNVYEGRGWNVVGAHTYGYNKKSIGISFIGCFMRERCPEISIKACHLLIKRGIELGHIAPDYILLGHCQCSATESPGRMLFEEIQKWPHFSLNP